MMFTTDLGVHGEWHDFMISSENFRYGESSWRWSGTYSDIIQIHKSREPWNAANSEAVLSLEDDTIMITWEDDYDGGADINGYWVKLYDVWLDYWVIYARPL